MSCTSQAKFNKTLLKGQVVVGIIKSHSTFDGWKYKAVVWDGKKAKTVTYFKESQKNLFTPNDCNVDASKYQIDCASKWVRLNKQAKKNMYTGETDYTGCVVVLKRSRKAPNGIKLLVKKQYDFYSRGRKATKIKVFDGRSFYHVSVNCIEKVCLSKRPSWSLAS